MELMAGRGPDIFDGSVFNVSESIPKKGVLADLAPGLDAMAITDEEYFPAVRALRMGNAVYGICTRILPHGYSIRESVLGSREQPDIESLVEKLYTYPDQKAVWRAYARCEIIIEYLLSDSEDLWGMIDWEKETCDFSGELFAKMLEIAKRYADPEGKSWETEERWLVYFYSLVSNSPKQLESKGKVIINYPAYERIGAVLMLNANSEHQEGAWEFLEYVLSEEGQGCSANITSLAVNREMSRSYFEYSLKLLEEGCRPLRLLLRRQSRNSMHLQSRDAICPYAQRRSFASYMRKPGLSVMEKSCWRKYATSSSGGCRFILVRRCNTYGNSKNTFRFVF